MGTGELMVGVPIQGGEEYSWSLDAITIGILGLCADLTEARGVTTCNVLGRNPGDSHLKKDGDARLKFDKNHHGVARSCFVRR